MKTYVLFHENCPDGAAAAYCAWTNLRDSAEYIPVNYGKPMPIMEDGSRVWILDFSYPRPQLKDLAKRMEFVGVLDHHATAEKDLEGLMEELRAETGQPHLIQFDMNKSGAMLAWEHFHSLSPVPSIISYVQDRDLWAWKLPHSREVSAALQMHGWTNETFERYTNEGVASLIADGAVVLKFKNQQVDIMAKNCRFVLFDTQKKTIRFESDPGTAAMAVHGGDSGIHLCPVANASVFFSEVGERMLELYPLMNCAAYYFDRREGKRQWGLRSRPSFNCATEIAKPFGGGGHPGAAGWTEQL